MKTVIIENKNSDLTYSLVYKKQLEQNSEQMAVQNVIALLVQKLGYKIEKNMLLLGEPPYCKLKGESAEIVYVTLDEYDGLSIDTKSIELLENLQPYFEFDEFVSGNMFPG
jgi:hypothetical protein